MYAPYREFVSPAGTELAGEAASADLVAADRYHDCGLCDVLIQPGDLVLPVDDGHDWLCGYCATTPTPQRPIVDVPTPDGLL